MKIRSEKGFTGIDISIAIIVVFIFISLIAMLSYNINSSTKELELRTEATYLAIDEIEAIKADGFEKYETTNNKDQKTDVDGNPLPEENEKIQDQEGFFRTIKIEDYTELPGNEEASPNIVKKATVQIKYMFKGKEQIVELSTVLSK